MSPVKQEQSDFALAINEHFKICSVELQKKFVSWFWLVGILVTFASIVGGVTAGTVASLKTSETKIDGILQKDREQDIQIERLQEMQVDIRVIKSIVERRLGKVAD